MDQIHTCESKQSCDASFSTSFEVYAAIGGDPYIDEVESLFVETSKAVLNIQDEETTSKRVRRRSARRRSLGSETKTKITAEVDVIDSDKLGVYCGSEDDIRCFSIVITILVTSNRGDLDSASSTAENLTFAAELAFESGEFEEKVRNTEGSILVHLMEMSPESSSNDADETNGYNSDDNSIYESGNTDDDDDDDDDDLSSLESGEFDNFLEESYREYLQDLNRQQILESLNLTSPPDSPSTVSRFPPEYAETCPVSIPFKPKTEPKVKFDPVVRVKNTLARHDMTPNESYNYWSCNEDSMSVKQRDQMLKVLTDKWTDEQDRESQNQAQTDLDGISPRLVPILPAIKQLLPSTEREGHDGYTYTVRITDK